MFDDMNFYFSEVWLAYLFDNLFHLLSTEQDEIS
jgi:hypothetical protein